MARAVRCRSLAIVHRAKAGHPGGHLSSADILVTFYFGVLQVDPNNPAAIDPERYNAFPYLWEGDAPPGERFADYVRKEWEHRPH